MLALVVVVALVGQAKEDPPPAVEPLIAPDKTKGLRAKFLVRAAPDVVLETLWDVKRFRSIFPDIHSLEVLAQTDSSVDAKFYVDAVLAKVSYTLRRKVDRAARTVTWVSVGGDLKSVRGSWQVNPTAEPGVSEVIYTSFVDVGYVVPSGMVRDVALGKVNEMATRVRAACAMR